MVRVTSRASFWRGMYWCGQECKKRVAVPVVSCARCGKEIRRRPGELRKVGEFCSKPCAYKHRMTGQNRDCMTCGKPVWKSKSQLHRSKWFCSLNCSITFEHRKKFGTDKPTCAVCGKEHQRRHVAGRGGFRKTCSPECANRRHDQASDESRARGQAISIAHNTSMVGLYGEWWQAWKRLRKWNGTATTDKWSRKFNNIVAGFRHRQKDLGRPRLKPGRRPRESWGDAFQIMLTNAKAKQGRMVKQDADPWARKLETMSRNWRRKASLMEWQRNESGRS